MTMVLKLLERCGAEEVWMAGFDGFHHRLGGSYYSRESTLAVNPAEVQEKQRRIGQQLQRLPLNLHFLTPSVYGRKVPVRQGGFL